MLVKHANYSSSLVTLKWMLVVSSLVYFRSNKLYCWLVSRKGLLFEEIVNVKKRHTHADIETRIFDITHIHVGVSIMHGCMHTYMDL